MVCKKLGLITSGLLLLSSGAFAAPQQPIVFHGIAIGKVTLDKIQQEFGPAQTTPDTENGYDNSICYQSKDGTSVRFESSATPADPQIADFMTLSSTPLAGCAQSQVDFSKSDMIAGVVGFGMSEDQVINALGNANLAYRESNSPGTLSERLNYQIFHPQHEYISIDPDYTADQVTSITVFVSIP
jgi:hypothetical protein